jgi:alanyl-tRNA synthetase
MKGHVDIRNAYARFWESRDHKNVPPIPLVPQNDPTTLFTGSGMQQLVPYLLGEPHPLGTRVYNIQPCLRSQDIEEIGDNRHTTFFEMMGNWSLGDYFKKEQLPWVYDFLTNPEYGLGLDPNRLYASVYSGSAEVGPDEDSIAILKEVFNGLGIDAQPVTMGSESEAAKKGMGNGRIFAYDAKKNWWSRAGVPENMPPGEPGGPDSEVFYLFEHVEHDPAFGEHCHPNCDCGRFIEIGNSVFMQFKKADDGSFQELPKPNVDFGGGLERQLAAVNNTPDVFTTDLYAPIVRKLEELSGKRYDTDLDAKKYFRIIADHVKGAIMLVNIDVIPSNKEQGYVVRRMLRRAIWFGKQYLGMKDLFIAGLVDPVVAIYRDVYPDLAANAEKIRTALHEEERKFSGNLEKGMREVPKIAERYAKNLHTEGDTGSPSGNSANALDKEATGNMLFFVYESFGFPPDLTAAMLQEHGWTFSKNFDEEFQLAKKAHQDKSRSGAEGKFKGGLADQSEQVVKYHTATHLLHQALFDVLGEDVRQEGSNITGERLRFDFRAAEKPTAEQLSEIEKIINDTVHAKLPVRFRMIPRVEAEKLGAKMFFKEKYPDTVKVYYIAEKDDIAAAYSKEFCGGPHVTNTGDIGTLKIAKLEKIGSNVFRIYAR